MTKRNPVTTYSPRIDPLAVLPVFFNLHGKKAMLVGATDGALWKAELLLASGAELHVYATAFSDAWQTLKNASPDHRLYLHQRLWQVDDLQGHALAVADLEEADVASFQEAARKAGALIQAAPIDVAFVGIGENGHLAFNDPPADFETEEPYLIVRLDEACRRQQVGEGLVGARLRRCREEPFAAEQVRQRHRHLHRGGRQRPRRRGGGRR